MPYTSTGPIAEAACDVIGWRTECRAIQVFVTKNAVLVSGTLLKPEEWRSLARFPWERHVAPNGKPFKLAEHRVPLEIRY